ncbi:hypothetical protein RFI_26394 [Reticulomyxa filosa]|uniref:Uncharacterized protein n=1 Tax=Reticulomyxa filosa TaxID=46433 RepID=X6MD72_RETFI|nr:hypothetical protein RFI_26394 [Reticulomyxa filosa]|eukprot:ETO10985.1 hypothetical protein RFI_26394 [Reticulomyxa filosa]
MEIRQMTIATKVLKNDFRIKSSNQFSFFFFEKVMFFVNIFDKFKIKMMSVIILLFQGKITNKFVLIAQLNIFANKFYYLNFLKLQTTKTRYSQNQLIITKKIFFFDVVINDLLKYRQLLNIQQKEDVKKGVPLCCTTLVVWMVLVTTGVMNACPPNDPCIGCNQVQNCPTNKVLCHIFGNVYNTPEKGINLDVYVVTKIRRNFAIYFCYCRDFCANAILIFSAKDKKTSQRNTQKNNK